MTGPRRRPRPPGAVALALPALLAAALAGLAGCRTTAVASQNLDAVLSSTDTFRYQGQTVSVWGDLLDRTLGILRTLTGQAPTERETNLIPNPTRFAKRNLIRIADARAEGSVWRRTEQVRHLVRFGASAPSQLARERALLELPAHARRLGVTGPSPPPSASAANASELLASLDGLVDAARSMLDDAEPTETELLDFEAAVDLLARAELDIDGGTRLLRAIVPFLRLGGLPDRAALALERLSVDVQARLVAQALHGGLRDSSTVARAGAYAACIDVFGEDFAIAALFSLVPEGARPDGFEENFGRFELRFAPPAFTDVHLATLSHFEAEGLPARATASTTLEAVELRRSLFEALALLATDRFLYPDRTRLAAMRALGRVSGGELSTLREEEWAAWFRARSKELSDRADVLRAARP